ncbi:kelch repeat protein [Gigaspora margarita]|uniref:Kelch repeat protein n=1 Tax=Gigaspora margarita TaxID=4874 RepID=A0A8H3WZ16_GIGMA|nr:kelch repeat protein [Gigaspora margarita]
MMKNIDIGSLVFKRHFWLLFRMLGIVIVLNGFDIFHSFFFPYTPNLRYSHTSLLTLSTDINNDYKNLYILGGRSNNDSLSSFINNEISSQIFYRFFNGDLDASLQIWKNFPNEQLPSDVSWVSAIQFKPNSLSCYLFGKPMNKQPNVESTLVYKLDSISGNISFIKSIPVDISKQHQALRSSSIFAPKPRLGYTATMMPSGQIFYIGGREFQDGDVNLNEMKIYDTNAGEWTSMEIDNSLKIDRRHGHTAVLTSDGNIIVYGGGKGELHITAYPQLFVLKKYRKSYKWVIPTVRTTSYSAPKLIYHSAVLHENFMIVSFGNFTNSRKWPKSTNKDLYILDINTFTWVVKTDIHPLSLIGKLNYILLYLRLNY